MCQGTWEAAQASLPIHVMTYHAESNELHCAQSPDPRHRLACNIPLNSTSNSREKRSLEPQDEIDHFTNIEVWSIMSTLVVVIFILCVLFAVLAVKYHRLLKKLKVKNNQLS